MSKATTTATSKIEESLPPVETTPAVPEFEYVTIPAKDLFGFPFHGVGINMKHWGPGTHKVNPEEAAEIREIVARAEAQDLKTISPRQDTEALRTLLQLARSKGLSLTNV